MNYTVREVINGRIDDYLRTITGIIDQYDDGHVTKTQMIATLKLKLVSIVGANFDFGFSVGVTADKETLDEAALNSSVLDIEVTCEDEDEE
jgi:hypothetical protein